MNAHFSYPEPSVRVKIKAAANHCFGLDPRVLQQFYAESEAAAQLWEEELIPRNRISGRAGSARELGNSQIG